MPVIFLIVGNVAGDIIDSIIDSARPMIDDRVIYNVTVGIYDFESESVKQGFGKPVATSTAKALDNFLSLAIIRESRYELHHRLMQL